jgi:hypothetical protein
MLNFNQSVELYYKNHIRDMIYKITEEEKEKKCNLVNVDNENTKYLLVTNGNKYFVWISKFNETEFLNNEEIKVEKAIVFIFSKSLTTEQWIIIPLTVINWEYTNQEYLFEGYLFDNELYFSDIIYPNYNKGYLDRREIIKNIFKSQSKLTYIKEKRGDNDIILGKLINMIEIKEDGRDETMKKLLLKNFKYKIENVSEEIVNGRELIKTSITREEKIRNEIELKEIEKGNKIELYNVYNVDTKNKEGLLLVKTLKQSKFLTEQFQKSNDRILINCKYDEKRKKWTIV